MLVIIQQLHFDHRIDRRNYYNYVLVPNNYTKFQLQGNFSNIMFLAEGICVCSLISYFSRNNSSYLFFYFYQLRHSN